MTTIAPRVKKILAIVEEIKAAIEEKGVTVPAAAVFGDIPGLILQILTADEATPIITDAGLAPGCVLDTIYALSQSGVVTDSITSYTDDTTASV